MFEDMDGPVAQGGLIQFRQVPERKDDHEGQAAHRGMQ